MEFQNVTSAAVDHHPDPASGLDWLKTCRAKSSESNRKSMRGQSTQPISHNVTLFTPKLICDMQMSDEAEPQPVEYVVFDTRQKLFVLLDVQREVRIEIFNLELMRLMEGLRRETMQNDRTKFLTDDTFEEDTDWSDGWVTLTSANITYQFKGSQPDDVSCLPPYFRFP